MKITALASGLGGVALEIECKDRKVALDAGVATSSDEVILTHAHLDHSIMAVGKRVYATLPTLALSRLLWLDSLSLDPELPWTAQDVQRTLSSAEWHFYKEPFTIGPYTVTFHNSSHILGSSLVMLECEGKRVLYTGDLGTSSFLLDHWKKTGVPKADLLIVESTYLCKSRPKAKDEWRKLAEYLKETLPYSPVLIAVNAVGKAQEVIKFLLNYKDTIAFDKIIVEGMAYEATKIYDDMLQYLKQSEIVSWLNGSRRKLTDHVLRPDTLSERRELESPGTVVVAPSGSLAGGMSTWWLLRGLPYVLLGHLFEPAASIVRGERPIIEDPLGKRGIPHSPALHLHISRHASREELLSFISESKANEVYLIHGERECMEEAAKSYGFNTLIDNKSIEF